MDLVELSDQKDLLPRAMRPDQFRCLNDIYHLDISGDLEQADQAVKDANQDKQRFERMRVEYDKLYTEFLTKQIKTMREK